MSITIVLLGITGVLLAFVARPFIRYFQDPKGFRKYPNQNLLSGVTGMAYNWEFARNHAPGQFHTRRLHEALKKQPVIRVGPNHLSFGRSRAVKDIYGYASPCNKGNIYGELNVGGKHLVNITSRALHSSRRRMVATAYAPKNIEMWEPGILDITATLVRKMDALCTTPLAPGAVPRKEDLTFDGNYWGMLYAFDCAIRVGMTTNVNFVAQGADLIEIEIDGTNGKKETVSLLDCLRSGTRANSTLVWDLENFQMLKKLTRKLIPWYRKNWAASDRYTMIIKKLIKDRVERHEKGEVFDDLLQPMITDKKTGGIPDISTPDLIAECEQMVNGGGDAPGISLVNTLYYLVKNPAAMTRLKAELDAALLPADEVATWAKTKSLPYLRACIDESMRLSPPVATDLARRTPPGQSHVVDGCLIPGDTNVSISSFTAHRDPDIFPDPEAFKPERWLVAEGEDREKLREMLTVYMPFSAGSRSCIGRNVAMLVQNVFVATLVHNYEFALTSPDWEFTWVDYFNLWPDELPLKIWKREFPEKA
ncbi:cytochrome P450 CYP5280A1P [Bombardia bombarda]|uniref:Cytochrome P450 CYP5280A1P n=1 Tax=Bombardia bombarda TaxID=252184 RepID=A0AA40CAB7_9PEZI|nr:cytochrome P450 CYP5280A1P [Bombardia bombarda]